MTMPGSPRCGDADWPLSFGAIHLKARLRATTPLPLALRWSPSKIDECSMSQDWPLKLREVEKLLDYYEVSGSRRVLLLNLARDASQKGWWEEYTDFITTDYQQFIGLEHEATSIDIWHVEVGIRSGTRQAYAGHRFAVTTRLSRSRPA